MAGTSPEESEMRRLALLPSLILALIAVAPVAAATVLEPIRADAIVAMLEEGIAPDVVLSWLSGRTEPVAALSADDLLRLRRAGADDALLRAMVERASAPAPTGAAPSAPAAVPEPARAAAPPDGDARVEVTIEYRPVEPMDGDERAPSPDLVLYVDGRFLARAAAQGDFRRRPVQFRTRLPVGRHVVRFAREFPEDDRDVARVAPEAIAFDLGAGDRWSLAIRWSESIMEFGRPTPLTWTLLDDGERVAGATDAGTPTDRWPELCEDLELAVGNADTRSARRRRERCVRWDGLFPDVAGAPSRADVRPARSSDGKAPEPATDPFARAR